MAPRVAATLDVGQVSDITKVISADTFERPIYAGNAIATVQAQDEKKVITVRTTGFDAAAATGGGAAVETVTAALGESAFLCGEIAKSDRPELTAAKIIVPGGRALGSSEKFNEVMTPLAEPAGFARSSHLASPNVQPIGLFAVQLQLLEPLLYPLPVGHLVPLGERGILQVLLRVPLEQPWAD